MFERDLKVGVFVDAANIHATIGPVYGYDKRLDYKKLLERATSDTRNYSITYKLFRAMVYAVKHGDNMGKFTDMLESMGYEVKVKEVTVFSDGRTKADWDVGLVMDVVRMIDSMDIVVLVTGDGDMVPLVRWCQSNGKIVKVIGVYDSTSRELRETADIYQPVDANMLRTMPQKEEPTKQISNREVASETEEVENAKEEVTAGK